MSTDDKIVSATFDSRKFESGVNKTISSVDKLNSSLKFPNSGKGLNDINRAAQKVDLSHISRSLDEVRYKFSALNVAASAIIAHIAIQAFDAGLKIAKSFTLQPLIAGFQEYSTNLNAIQTILANTQASGAGLKEVNSALDELNEYSDKTIYNFSEMARNIGTFTAAGVGLKPATAAIKGIANLAALSGSNSQQASTAMYQLSQAIASGRVSLMDWNSVVNAGMGGTVFQRALAQTAVAMGNLKDSSLKLVGPMKNVSINGESFRQSMMAGPGHKSWLTSDVLTKTLQQFTGDMSDAELKTQGFNAEQIKAIKLQAKTAQEAATQVKTISQVFEVAKETAGSGWAKTFQLIFGDFGEAKTTFTAVSNAINGFINTSADARNKVLGDWKKLGGRAILIDNIRIMFKNLGSILRPIKKAFRDVFPAKTGKDLLNLTVRFAEFAQALKPTPTTMQNLRRTFRGLFAVLDIGKQIISGVVSLFGVLFHSAGGGKGSFLSLTASIGDWLVSIDEVLKKGNAFNNFFVKMGVILGYPLKIIHYLAVALASLFSGFSSGGFSRDIDSMNRVMTPFQIILVKIGEAWKHFLDNFNNSGPIFQKTFDAFSKFAKNFGPALGDAVSHINFETILQVVRTGLLVGLTLMLKEFLGKGSFSTQISKVLGKSFGKLGGGLTNNINNSLKAFTGQAKAMQTNIKAKTLKEIAIAIALLAASVLALSLVDPKRLGPAMTAMTVMLGELIGAMMLIDKFIKTGAAIKIPILAASLILLATAIDLLTIAVFALGKLSWDELKKGLIGVTTLLVGLTVASGPLSKSGPGLILAGTGVTAIAIGLNIMALAVRQLGSMDTRSLVKGLSAIAISLGIIAVTVRTMPKLLLPTIGVGLILVATSLNLLALAVKKFGALNWETLGKGLAGIGGSLVAIGIAMNLMPINMPLTAVGLILVSLALGKIAKAIGTMGRLSVRQIAKGIISLGLALGLLADGLYAMSGSLAGAAALTIAATGIAILTPALINLGKQSWNTIVRGLITLAGALGIIGAAGLLLAPVAPALLALGAALVLIGGGLALAGAGIALIGVGLSAIAIAGPTAVAILIQALQDFTEAIPRMVTNLVLGLLAMVQAFAKAAPAFTKALAKIFDLLLNVVIKSIPKMVTVIELLIDAIIKILSDKQDKIIQAGFDLLIALMKGISNNIGEVVKQAGNIIVNFLNGLANQTTRIIKAGVGIIVHLIKGITSGLLTLIDEGAKAIVKFLNGVADAIEKYEPQILKAGVRIGVAIVKGMIIGLKDEAGDLYKNIKHIGKTMVDHLKHPWRMFSPSRTAEDMGKNIVKGLGNGITKNQHIPVDAIKKMNKNMMIAATGTFGITKTGTFGVMDQLGKDIAGNFAKALRGSSSDIKQAFRDLNSQLFDAAASARQTIKEENDKIKQEQNRLKELTKHPKKNAKEISDSVKAIAASRQIIIANQEVIDKATAGHIALTQALRNEKLELLNLVKGYNDVAVKLDKANQVLADAKQLRKDAFSQYKDDFSQLPDIVTTDSEGNAVDQLDTYEQALQAQIDATKKFQITLNKLRALGLDDTTYKRLLADGTVDQKFADELLAGGKTAVKGLNKLDSQLSIEAKSFAKDAAGNLYDAGIAAAQGLVDGLKSKKSELSASIIFLAKKIVGEMNKALGIKSPSKVFAEIGEYATLGLAQGIIDSSKAVTDSMFMVSDDAMRTLKNSLSNISSLVADEINPNPTITPILDLSQIQTGVKSLDSILKNTPIRVITKYSSLSSTKDTAASDISSGETMIKFEQNNYSPEALPPSEIYRLTRNQLSKLRELTKNKGV